MSDSLIGTLIFFFLLLGVPAILLLLTLGRNFEGVFFYNLVMNIVGSFNFIKLSGEAKDKGDTTPIWTSEKSIISPYMVFIYLLSICGLGLGFMLYYQSNRLTALIIPFVVIVILILSVFVLPKRIILLNNGLQLDNKFIRWQTVEKIHFTLSLLGDLSFSSQAIEITLKDKCKLRIPLRFYCNHPALRESFERIAIEQGIKTTVEDRGV